MQNYNYIVLSPQKKVKPTDGEEHKLVDTENERYKIKPV